MNVDHANIGKPVWFMGYPNPSHGVVMGFSGDRALVRFDGDNGSRQVLARLLDLDEKVPA